MRTRDDLRQLQALPLELKIPMTKRRIREWVSEYGIDGVYVSFSGGKDSTVLLHIVREMYPEIEAVFVDTGLEYPEIRQFVKTFENVTILRPKMRFDEVIKKYGYPLISKEVSECVSQAKKSLSTGKYTYRLQKLRGEAVDKEGRPSLYNQQKYEPLLGVDFEVSAYCCNVLKKNPAKEFERRTGKKPMLAMMAAESRSRETAWIRGGCNSFESKRARSMPMAFWTEQDILAYIKRQSIPIAGVYGSIEYANEPEQLRWGEISPELSIFETKEQQKLKTTGCDRTGCIYCAFGCHLREEPPALPKAQRNPPPTVSILHWWRGI